MTDNPQKNPLVPRRARPIDVEHDELMARAKAEHEARTAASVAATAADRAAVLRWAADHLARQADELWAPGRTAHTVMHADADELRRMADEAQQPTSPTTFSPDEGVHGRDPYYASDDAETQQQPAAADTGEETRS